MKAATPSHIPMMRPGRFQSTPPVKAATGKFASSPVTSVFQSTPPVKAATLAFCNIGRGQEISIHAAREGGDNIASSVVYNFKYFNPRRP